MTGIVNAKHMRLTALVYDMAMAGLAMYAALILRLGTFRALDNYSLVGPFNGLGDYSLVFGALLPFVVAAAVSLLILGTYRTSWRHASTADLTNIVKAAVHEGVRKLEGRRNRRRRCAEPLRAIDHNGAARR
jgi:FlaA1/EpsC-like NDP-sugar epimerase